MFRCRGSEVVRGYDFLVNSVWPEVVSNIEAKTSSMFAPGNPDIFHAVSIVAIKTVYVRTTESLLMIIGT